MTEHSERERRRSGGPRKTHDTTISTGSIQREDEAAIRQLVRNLQDAQNQKDGKLFASVFAQEHDYIAVHGMLLADQTRGENARVHQRLYNERRSSVVGNYGEVEVRLNVSQIRLLTPEIAVVYVQGIFRKKGQPEKKAENIITAVMQEREDRWEIVSFHNAPVQKRQEEETGFVIRIEGVDAQRGGNEVIKDVPLIGVFVNDQEAALDFYADKLGLEKVQDEAYGPDARWITVSPAATNTRIVLKKAEKEYEKAMVGNSDGAPILTLRTDDIHAAYKRLKERGVRFLGDPYRYPWGIGALLLDQDGSPILLQEEWSER
jgi:uncharacterized protein (TIGR02246 family)